VRNNKGFTLIELMIVVAIIAILAAIAIPNFLNFVTKTKRSEVKYNLSAIYKAEVSYFGEANAFSNSFQEIRWVPAGTIYYYTFSVGTELYGKGEANPGVPAAADSLSFTAYGWGSIDTDPVLDVWYINDRNEMVIETDDMNS
jgi:prepilin-type N-terminal cleavage/methylation domain-containing protein